MHDNPSISEPSKRNRSWAWLIFSAVIFGGLMRSELQSIWLRALVAGVAFAFLWLAVQGFRRKA
jgi:hypothetical protein